MVIANLLHNNKVLPLQNKIINKMNNNIKILVIDTKTPQIVENPDSTTTIFQIDWNKIIDLEQTLETNNNPIVLHFIEHAIYLEKLQNSIENSINFGVLSILFSIVFVKRDFLIKIINLVISKDTKYNIEIMLLCFIIVCVTAFCIEIFSAYVYINTINSIPIPFHWGELVQNGLDKYRRTVEMHEQIKQTRLKDSFQKITTSPSLKDYLDNERHKGMILYGNLKS
ncbi:unnamed protein product (mitochondrion) [Parajaminaea phylloscopi]|uniref:Uncharacterized protein n=1 Tax=Parajaminaea phylloscopi TaxID=1463510 RepID=A0AB39A704_9BASI